MATKLQMAEASPLRRRRHEKRLRAYVRACVHAWSSRRAAWLAALDWRLRCSSDKLASGEPVFGHNPVWAPDPIPRFCKVRDSEGRPFDIKTGIEEVELDNLETMSANTRDV